MCVNHQFKVQHTLLIPYHSTASLLLLFKYVIVYIEYTYSIYVVYSGFTQYIQLQDEANIVLFTRQFMKYSHSIIFKTYYNYILYF